jgi:hypothetical protein
VSGDRRYPSDVGRDTPDHSMAEPATAAHLDVRVGDRVRYRGTTRELRVGEVLEVGERLVLIRRPAPASENWGSLNGGVWPIKRERIIEVVERR